MKIKDRRTILGIVVIVIILGLTVFAFKPPVKNQSLGSKLLGKCNATDYFLPDRLRLYVTNITTVSNSSTSYYLSTYSTQYPTTQTLNSTSYTTTTIESNSTAYTFTSTINLNPYSPSAEWQVVTCTFTANEGSK